jgi:predicted DCC family thiol-disulfide oxidoreductase YuxK
MAGAMNCIFVCVILTTSMQTSRIRSAAMAECELVPSSHSAIAAASNQKTCVKPEAAITVFELLMMGDVSLETCRAIKRHCNNKFYYTVAFCWFFL